MTHAARLGESLLADMINAAAAVSYALRQDSILQTASLLVVLAIVFLSIPLVLSRLRHSSFLATTALRALRCGGPIPSHIAFIMDGNRRWATRGGLRAHEGHPYGGEKLIESLQWCLEAGVKTVTVYAFSIENFKRSNREVDEIMQLAMRKFYTLADRADVIHANRVRVRVLGDLTLIPSDLRALMTQVMLDTEQYVGGCTLNICFAYTSRHDMASAIQQLSGLCRDGHIGVDQISEKTIGACLSTGYAKGAEPNSCYPELLVRTSGETRLSDFLLWEASDAILSFYPVLWPDLTSWDFVNIVLDYQGQCSARQQGQKRRGREREHCNVDVWDEKKMCATSNERATVDALNVTRRRYFRAVASYSGRERAEPSQDRDN